MIGAHRVLSETYTIRALRPDSRYIFIVRAENSHGLGLPSPASEAVRTLGEPGPFVLSFIMPSIYGITVKTCVHNMFEACTSYINPIL